MKTFTKILLTLFVLMAVIQTAFSQQQIQFNGLISNGFGLAGWNADGTGPEPAGTGHFVPLPGFGNLYYYGSTRDYVSGDPDHGGFQFLPGMTGFPQFTQALADHGYSPEQVVLKTGLVSLGDDEEGLDWFVMGNHHYSNHYIVGYQHLELDGEPMLALDMKYLFFSVSTTGNSWFVESDYSPVTDISDSSSAGVKAAAQAFLDDLGGKEIKFSYQCPFAGSVSFMGNGRSGAYYNVTDGILTTGHPTLPFQGLYADNEGFAGWDADGTGPEPSGDGHLSQQYYGASVDYDGINPHPDACLGHFLDGSTGFLNTLLQLEYRGFDIDDLKIKLGLNSLGPDVEGEDWGYENGLHWCNYYNNHFVIELNGEPILTILADTNKLVSHSSYWTSGTTAGKVYDISENAAPAAQFVAQSFLKDMGTHYLNCITDYIEYVTLFSGNGRDGAIYQITEGKMTGLHKNMTFVPPGMISGTWAAEGSPYYVDGHLEIADGETLIIEPGVKVAVRGPYHFTVQGCVKAEGTEEENIIFTRSNPNLQWDGFDYDMTPTTNELSVFEHCLFEHSSALGNWPYNSGGVFAVKEYDSILIDHCVFRSNEALRLLSGDAGGAAIALWGASPVIRHSDFYDNKSRYGGAIFCYSGSNPEISRCLFYNNNAIYDGGAIEIWSSSPEIINNTFSLNSAQNGGAVDIYSDLGVIEPIFVNNIFWDNTAVQNGNQISILSANCEPMISYSNVEGGREGIGPYSMNPDDYRNNLDTDPLFVDAGAFNFILDEWAPSPCIDAGDPASPPDPDGSPADMGCYYQTIATGITGRQANGFMASTYPNPFSDHLNIHFELTETASVRLYIYNSTGALVDHADYGSLQPGNVEKRWNSSAMPEGVYFLVIKTNDGHYTGKIVKIK